MKRLLAVLAIGILAAIASPNVASASAASCSNINTPAPFLGGGINQEASANCTAKWVILFRLQFEQSGNWKDAVNDQQPMSGGVACPDTAFSPCFTAGSHDPTWVSSGLPQLPYCAYNWRDVYTFITWNSDGSQHDYFQTSAELHKTC